MKYSKESFEEVASGLKNAEEERAKLEEQRIQAGLPGKQEGFIARTMIDARRKLLGADIASKRDTRKQLRRSAKAEASAWNKSFHAQAEQVQADVQNLRRFFETNKAQLSAIHQKIIDGKIPLDSTGYPTPKHVAERRFLQEEKVYRTELASKADSLFRVLKENYYNMGFIKKHYDILRPELLKYLKGWISEKRKKNGQEPVASDEEVEKVLRYYEQMEPSYAWDLRPLAGQYLREETDEEKEFTNMLRTKAMEMLPLPEVYTKIESLAQIIAMELPLTSASPDVESVMDAAGQLTEVVNYWRIQNPNDPPPDLPLTLEEEEE